ncbi:MAG: hypothetical protein ACXVAY_06435 [Mucilaginibacter sp.]
MEQKTTFGRTFLKAALIRESFLKNNINVMPIHFGIPSTGKDGIGLQLTSRRPRRLEYPVGCRNKFGMNLTSKGNIDFKSDFPTPLVIAL